MTVKQRTRRWKRLGWKRAIRAEIAALVYGPRKRIYVGTAWWPMYGDALHDEVSTLNAVFAHAQRPHATGPDAPNPMHSSGE
jgi:hypothetical protein